MKSLLILDRTKSRDYFDLLTLYKSDEIKHSALETIKLIKEYHPFYGNNEEFLKSYLDQRDSGINDETLDGLLNNETAPSFKELKHELNTVLFEELNNILSDQLIINHKDCITETTSNELSLNAFNEIRQDINTSNKPHSNQNKACNTSSKQQDNQNIEIEEDDTLAP